MKPPTCGRQVAAIDSKAAARLEDQKVHSQSPNGRCSGAGAQTWALGQLEHRAPPDFQMFTKNKTKKEGQ